MLRHVFFWALPIGTGYWHKKGWYVKTGEEEAYSISEQRRWIFEIHYGCVIHQDLVNELGLEEEAFCECCPEDIPPATEEYYQKLFGVPI